jgi:hypothetical protein
MNGLISLTGLGLLIYFATQNKLHENFSSR